MKTAKYKFITGWHKEGDYAQKEREGYLLCLFPKKKGGWCTQWVRKEKVFV